ncbi:protein-disulfide reductase DsbD [Stenotrophomonas sp. HITSZ_GD]|uniref:protein-disulfide reductase DsbD family protein n=1 Tax=Stenotrophomonas sp. HITSZ_GD TaxID=3037248 RepID=UPI00240DB416|nr:protein-disulfide reductase DsbD [Stenotrophomonas sp. HITSZ_GD]MDG2526131.1 protein-disulfide reductase DsbD [Stenotrophomonas sp. HITSZ_GD]
MKWLHRFLALCALSLSSLPALAFTEADLLPVDQAFALSARADGRDGIELQWKIAEGYYLYRHRIAVTPVGPGFAPGPLTLPDGHKKHDEFFGNVETYRGQLRAVLAGEADPGAREVALEVRYQGCADAGVCYPPQKRRIEVALPDEAAPAVAKTGGLPRPAGLPGAGPGLPGLPGSGLDALPLPAEQAFAFEAIVGDGNTLLLRFTPAPGYYLYRDRTSLALEGSKDIATGVPRWPPGRSHHDEHFGDVVVYFDQAEVSLPLLRRQTAPADITLVATFQGCQTDGICYPPMTRRVKLSLPAGKLTPPEQASAAPLPIQPLPGNARPAPAARAPAYPDASADNDNRSVPPPQRQNLLWVLIAALAGGLVLNLMPCVLPILSLKVLGLAHSGESRARARSHALWYSLGVLVSFSAIGALVIGLRAAGQAAGWGFQLQQPWFVAMLAYLMFAIGLSLSGLFTLGGAGGLGQSLASRNGPVGDFFTGVLACVVASPCIAPFMGTALAYAFAAPALPAMLVFVVLGLGLALPFLLIGFVPSLARRLPTPGPWMETLKQVLAFPMYLTAIWLLWVLGKQRGVDALALVLVGATLLALGLWWFERSRWRSHRLGLTLSSAMLVLALLPVWGVTRLAPPRAAAAEAGEVAYSAQLLDRLRADNRVVFVNMTADWCVTCKANERHVLGSGEFRDTLRRVDAVYMTGDWTNEDPAISAFLKQHQAVGVPLYVVYGPGAPPTVLPTVLTQAIVEDALLRAAR